MVHKLPREANDILPDQMEGIAIVQDRGGTVGPKRLEGDADCALAMTTPA